MRAGGEQPRQGAVRLAGGIRGVNRQNRRPARAEADRSIVLARDGNMDHAVMDSGGSLPAQGRTKCQTQRESRCGAPPPRVCHEPSGALYFSPGWVCAIRLQPLVKASCSTVAPDACAFCV